MSPGWELVLSTYHQTCSKKSPVQEDDSEAMTKLCSLFCKMEHVDLCDARTIPSLGDLNTLHPVGRLWRFQVSPHEQTKRSTGCVRERSS